MWELRTLLYFRLIQVGLTGFKLMMKELLRTEIQFYECFESPGWEKFTVESVRTTSHLSSQLPASPGICKCKYKAGSILILRRRKMRRFSFSVALRSRKSVVDVSSAHSPVEVFLPVVSENNHLLTLSDELLLRIMAQLELPDLIRWCQWEFRNIFM